MYDEDSEQIKILWDLIRFFDHNKNHNRKFIDDIYDFYEKNECITYPQYQILKKIYKEKNVDDFFEKLEEIHQREPSYF